MKKLIFAAVAINLVSILLAFSITAQGQGENQKARRILRCNPPTGSHLQEVEIFMQQSGKVYLRELNMYGSPSEPISISSAAWDKQQLRWASKNEGSVQMSLVDVNGMKVWSYKATSPYKQIIGYCERTDLRY